MYPLKSDLPHFVDCILFEVRHKLRFTNDRFCTAEFKEVICVFVFTSLCL